MSWPGSGYWTEGTAVTWMSTSRGYVSTAELSVALSRALPRISVLAEGRTSPSSFPPTTTATAARKYCGTDWATATAGCRWLRGRTASPCRPCRAVPANCICRPVPGRAASGSTRSGCPIPGTGSGGHGCCIFCRPRRLSMRSSPFTEGVRSRS